MDIRHLSGYYTYRSFIDTPAPVNDFNKIRFAEAELYIHVQLDGTLSGTLSFPANPGSSEKAIMDIEAGRVKPELDVIKVQFNARGRQNSSISDYLYSYYGVTMHEWKNDIIQKQAFSGTILRLQDHKSGERIAKAGMTASFIAVKRDFVEPRDIKEIALIPRALEMLSSKNHRLIHALWHTLRGRVQIPERTGMVYTTWFLLNDSEKARIKELGWNLERPPFTTAGGIVLENGAGEDFLYMHRKMITMVRNEYESQGIPYIQSWSRFLPSPDTAQYEYSELDDPSNPGMKIFKLNSLQTGNMVPLSTYNPNNSEDDNTIDPIKSLEYFNNVIIPMVLIYTNPRYLAALSLGAVGNLIEFTIHGWMHVRWANDVGALLPGSKPGEFISRDTFDFDDKWNDPKYDYLGEFYSSHVNPLFWRLHGWVDDRIEDWFNAHETANPGEIERFEYDEVSWFKPGKWVKAEKPFYWPPGSHNHPSNHHHGANTAISNMIEIMRMIENAIKRQEASVTKQLETLAKIQSVSKRPGGLMNFASSMSEIQRE
jgi:hypothetical protein